MNMKKNMLLLAGMTAVTLSTIAYATEAPANKQAFSGATVSGAIGYASGNSKYTQNAQQIGGASSLVTRSKLGLSGVSGELGLGYQGTFDCFYMGAELYAALSSLKGSQEMNERVSFTTTLKSPFAFGLKIRPGVMVNPKTVIHLTIGVGSARWKMNVGKDTKVVQLASASASKMLLGFSYGLGVMTKVCPNLSAGLEFVRTDYYKAPTLTQTSAVNPAVSLKQSFKPSTNVVSLRVTYHF